MATLDTHKNLASSAVATAPSPATSGTSLVVTGGHGTRFPSVPFNATVWPNGAVPDPANAEIVRVTAIATDTLTITRAQEGTTARTVVVGDRLAATITVKMLTDIETQFLQLTGGTLTGALLFSTDNTLDVGAAGATRPRDLHLGRNALVGGTLGAGATSVTTLRVGTSTTSGWVLTADASGNATWQAGGGGSGSYVSQAKWAGPR